MARIPDIMELLGASHNGLDPAELRKFLAGAGNTHQSLTIGPYAISLARGEPMSIAKGVNLHKPIELNNIRRTDVFSPQVTRQPAKFRQPKGKFRQLLSMLETEGHKAGYDSMYIDQIVNEFLPDVLASAGYSVKAPLASHGQPSMYKRLESPSFRRMDRP